MPKSEEYWDLFFDRNDEMWTAPGGKVYYATFCERCQTPIIFCTECMNASCTGGGCDICYDDFEAFFEFLENKG